MSDLIGYPVLAFTLPDQHRKPFSLGSLAGSNALVVYIPFPSTGICGAEACEIQ